jgi:Cyclin, C-terminal domain/Cyclin, N-terminal domain
LFDTETEESRSHTVFSLTFISACIWIASKIEDRTPPSSDQLNFISDNACSAEALIQWEARILAIFKFRPLRITPVHFLDIHERASQASTDMVARRHIHQHHPQFHHLFLYILQLACSNYQLSYEKPSLVAAAACFLTRATLGLRSAATDDDEEPQIWTPTLEFYTGYPLVALSRVVVLLLMCYMEAEKLNSALFTIYRLPERYRVSLKTAPRIESLALPGVPTEYGTYENLVEMIEERKTIFLDEV